MTGKKSFWMLFTILMVSFAFLIFIGGTEPDSSIVNPAGNGENPDVELVELPEGDKPLHVAVSLSSSEFRVMQTLSEQFGKQHAHVVVHLENTPASEWNDRLEHSLYQREATDILLLDNVRIGEFASAGLLLPLDDVFKQDERGGYLPQVLDQAKWNGYVWAVPKEVDPYVFVLNPDALREAGLSGMPGTTEEIVNWSRILQNRYGIGVYVNPDDPLAISSLYAVMGDDLDRLFSSPEDHAGIPGDEALANEGSPEDRQEVPPEGQEVPPAGEEARSVPSDHFSKVDDAWREINEGRFAMMIARVTEFRANGRDGLRLLPLSVFRSSEANQVVRGWMTGKSFTVFSGTSVKPEAADWIRYMTAPDAQIRLLNAGGALPANIAAYRNPTYREIPHFEEMLIAAEQSRAIPPGPEIREELARFKQDMLLWLNGEMSTERLFGRDWLNAGDVSRTESADALSAPGFTRETNLTK